MLIIWLIITMILLAAAYLLIPKKSKIAKVELQDEPLIRRRQFQNLLVEEKDTKRFYEDIRKLYPL